jgi:hypothetical protein
VSSCYTYTSLSFNYFVTRTIHRGLERYIRNVAEDLRDIQDVVKMNGAELDGLNIEQPEHFKKFKIWQDDATTSLERLREDGGTTYQEVKIVRKEQEDRHYQTILEWTTPIDYTT